MKLFIVTVADKRNSSNLMQCQMVRQFMEVFIVLALAVIDGKRVQTAEAHPCYISGKKHFSVHLYYLDEHQNYV